MYDAETTLRDLLHDAAPRTEGVEFDHVAARVARRRTSVLVIAASVATTGVLVSTAALLSPPVGAPVADPAPSVDTSAPAPGPTSRPTPGTVPNLPPGQCDRGSGGSITDYIDFVQYDGRGYQATGEKVRVRPMPPGTPFPGRRLATVTCTLSITQPDPFIHHPQDGDAGFLPAGTELYAVYGDSTAVRIAAKTPSGFWIYEASR